MSDCAAEYLFRMQMRMPRPTWATNMGSHVHAETRRGMLVSANLSISDVGTLICVRRIEAAAGDSKTAAALLVGNMGVQ